MNLRSYFNDPSSSNFQLVHIRGSQFRISSAIINSLLGNNVSSNCAPSLPSNDELTSILSGSTLSVWSVNRIPVVSLSIKYVILHKIGIVNWFPSSHVSSVSATLGMLLYQIGMGFLVDVGLFIYTQLLRHVGTYGVKISIALHRFFCSLLLHI